MERLVIKKEIVVDAPPERVWPFVGTQDGLQRWRHPHEIVLEALVAARTQGNARRESAPARRKRPGGRRGHPHFRRAR